MKRALVFGAFAIGVSTFAYADIYKCTDAYGIAYQSAPCAPGQQEVLLALRQKEAWLASPKAPAAVPRALAPAPATALRQDVVFRRTSLAIGMSDDEVLNLPGWGIPTRIVRSREGRAWHEEWTYEPRGGGARRLHFANARLAAVEIEQPVPAQIVSWSPQ